MNDLMRPALYDAFHDLKPVRPRTGEDRPYDVVGPVCETGDTFARDRDLPPLEAGDLVVFMSAGAYGAVMSGEYNTRPPGRRGPGRWRALRGHPPAPDL